MKVQPYVFFDGRCDEAIAFYGTALGATVVMRVAFKDSPDQTNVQPGMGDKVMHAELRVGDTAIYVSDGHCAGVAKFDGFNLNATVKTPAEADAIYAKLLADGGKPMMPLTKTFFSPKFGMLTDKFGVGWMVYVAE